MTVPFLGVDPLFVTYVGAFALAALGCFAGLLRVNRITDTDVRRGLTALLLTSGGWATAHVGYLASPIPQLQHAFYVVGLIVGIATVGPWLYFCSAYTGRSLHRNQAVRRMAVATFLLIISIKLTNPTHGWYYSTSVVSEPFPHLLVTHGALHWVVMGAAYALAFVGFFMLFELFLSVDYNVTPVMVLVGVTGIPVATDVAGVVSEAILELTYSPLGVSVFAVGVMFGYLDLFQQIQFTGDSAEFTIFIDDDGYIRDFSPMARERFPSLKGARGELLSTVLPTVAELLDSSESVLEFKENGTSRYYHVSENSFVNAESTLGSVAVLSDITEREQYRQELERQNERLEQFASLVSHDLRNPLNVAAGHLDLVQQEHDSEHLDTMGRSLTRMDDLITDLLTLARQGQPIDDTEETSLSALTTQAWELVETDECDLVVDSDHYFHADTDRARQLFENLFRNAVEHGGSVSTVRVGELDDEIGFYIEDDGRGIPEDEREHVFEFGYTNSTDGTGFGLAIVSEIADAHQWTVEITDSDSGGARFEFTTRGWRHTQQTTPNTASVTEPISTEP